MAEIDHNSPFIKALDFVVTLTNILEYDENARFNKVTKRAVTPFIDNIMDIHRIKIKDDLFSFTAGDSKLIFVIKDDKEDAKFEVFPISHYMGSSFTLIASPSEETLDELDADTLISSLNLAIYKIMGESSVIDRADDCMYLDKYMYIWCRYFMIYTFLSNTYNMSDELLSAITKMGEKMEVVNPKEVFKEKDSSENLMNLVHELFDNYAVLGYCTADIIDIIKNSFE